MEDPAQSNIRMPLYTELRRRNVFKVAFVYFVAAALAVWLSQLVQTQLALPWWSDRLVMILAAVGFPVALIFSWVYEYTPAGLRKAIEVDQTQSLVLPELVIVPPPPAALDHPVAANVPPEIRSFTLDNGLKIIVWPDHDIPNVVMYNFVRAGARNEYPGITGLSHFFEHMMFNGSDNVPPGDFDRLMEAAGGANNAYTSQDVTVYQDWFPRAALGTIFYLESDRLANLKIDPEVVESERGVVYSERRTGVDNDNNGLLYEQVMATAFVAHPYQIPVIGWPSDIENWRLGDLENYFRT